MNFFFNKKGMGFFCGRQAIYMKALNAVFATLLIDILVLVIVFILHLEKR